MEINTLIVLAGTMVKILSSAKFDTKETRTNHINALSNFLGSIAECLIQIKTELARNRVPTFAGNKLKQALADYEGVIKKAPLHKQVKTKLLETKAEIQRCLTSGEVQDKILRGYILRAPENNKEAVLLDIERTAAKLQGIAEALPISS
jgi:hypothetical protein